MLEIDGSQTASVFQANRDTMVRGNMVKKGRSQQEAEAGIDMLITLTKLVDQIKLSVGTQEDLTSGSTADETEICRSVRRPD